MTSAVIDATNGCFCELAIVLGFITESEVSSRTLLRSCWSAEDDAAALDLCDSLRRMVPGCITRRS